jgi:acetyl esterase/lipase
VQADSVLDRKAPDPDRRITYGSDPNQFIDVRFPAGKGPHPAVLFIHGGYWRAQYHLTHAGHLCAALAKAGIVTWNIEYRRVGNPGGGWPGTFEDVRTAYRFVLEQKNEIDPGRICVAGHSAGGQLALCLAGHEKSVTRAFSLAGVLDLRRGWEMHLSNDAVAGFLGGSPQAVPEHYREASPAELAIPQAVQKLIHGTADDSVPYEIGKSYAEHKKKAGEDVELTTLKGADHLQIIDPTSAVWPKVEAIFRALVSSINNSAEDLR